MMWRRRAIGAICWLVLAVCSPPPAEAAPPPGVTVFAAASLTDALKAIGAEYTRSTGTPVVLSFASSAIVAEQIEAGARADLFVSADGEWMDYLQQRRLVRAGSRRDLLGGRLALVAARSDPVRLRIGQGFRLAAALRGGRLAVGDPASVPAGRYAQAALTALGVWPDVADRLARAENVRVALLYVARGEAPLGVVYETDALADPRVRVVGLFPPASHPPIVYPVAITTSATPQAAGFYTFLRGPRAAATFRKLGFRVF